MRLMAFFLIVIMQWFVVQAYAQDVDVPDDYDTIQKAIDAIAENPALGNVIVVDVGTYEENLTLTSNITLRGKEAARTIINVEDENIPLLQMSQVTNVTIQNFTFAEGDRAIEVLDSSNVLISNNVFNGGNDMVGVTILSDPASNLNSNFAIDILNNTFFDLDRAIVHNDEAVTIQNNIFSKNELAIDSDGAFGVVSYNCFFDNNQPSARGTNTVIDDDPLFVNTLIRDFHLREGSPCIDQGFGNDIIDDSDADMGAYGGQLADVLPYPVQAVSAADITAEVGSSSLEVSWGANNAYLVTHTTQPGRYVIEYDSDRSGPPYNGTDAEGGTQPSPIDVGNVTAFRLTDLSPNQVEPSAPVLSSLDLGNGQFTANWTAVSPATSYNVHYGLNDTQEQQVAVGNVTSYTVTGLANGATYHVAISAVSQPTYYIVVTAYDSTGNNDHKSAVSEEEVVTLGSELSSELSNALTVIPEMTQAFPPLPNDGCFIATAAYGFYSVPQVQALRDFRDHYLLTNEWGRVFVEFYYRYSPPLAAYIAERPALRTGVRIVLAPFVVVASLLKQFHFAMVFFFALLIAVIGWPLFRRQKYINIIKQQL
ncbi:hypothetical protein MNBD_GAMMA16-453 [hydrothermal vent metagenome]|uniref:Fibronectin type-III domain-containing protein n=1 Tax=hydrothermal vent metagenome TaxID=652676 RepID=A0A3B0ZA55_9ZZZZ